MNLAFYDESLALVQSADTSDAAADMKAGNIIEGGFTMILIC